MSYNANKDKTNRYRNNIEMFERFIEYGKTLKGKEKKEYEYIKERLIKIIARSKNYENILFIFNDNHIPRID